MEHAMRLNMLACLALTCSCAFAQNGADDGELDPVGPHWVAQRAGTKLYRFSARVEVLPYSQLQVSGLRIHDRRTGKLRQEFTRLDGGAVHGLPDQMVRMVDANFDGEPDIALAMDMASPNDRFNYYLYNPGTRRFVLEPTLSKLSLVKLNADHTITSYANGGCCHELEARYRYIDGRLTQVYSMETITLSPNRVEVKKGKRVNGRMKYQTVVKEQ
ncbi:MAG: XAC2610-related protein [Gammaproteobacteria bacterium]